MSEFSAVERDPLAIHLLTTTPVIYKDARLTVSERCVCYTPGCYAMADCGRCDGSGWIRRTYEPSISTGVDVEHTCTVCGAPEWLQDPTTNIEEILRGYRKYVEYQRAMSAVLGAPS